MKKLLIVVDMQNDFVTGVLGSPEAQAIVPAVQAKIAAYQQAGQDVLFTRDTHGDDYLQTQEGKHLPVPHCIAGTPGHQIIPQLNSAGCECFDKPVFGSTQLAQLVASRAAQYEQIELCGVCTDICVVSNALLLKATLPEMPLFVQADCCAGVTPQSHEAALLTLKMCQVNVQ